ncbi:MAG: small ribosomal subunit Rsm22 family protein, partial [Spirochaetaceae bacterium]|nr:small ribosomal subunit Rsm22 family protein [Spirochaetaceae bacterium]
MFAPLSAETARALEALLACIERTFPLPARFAIKLPSEIAALSRLFTSARTERDEGYFSRAGYRNAYLRYFLPWNVYRLCRLFASVGGGTEAAGIEHCAARSEGAVQRRNAALRQAQNLPWTADFEPMTLQDGAVCVDIGSGTLALPIALWIAFPDLRSRRLVIYCVDKNAAALAAGRRLFDAFTAEAACKWHIVPVKTDFSRFKLDCKADFVSSFNVFNELYANIKQGDVDALTGLAGKTARAVSRLLAPGGLLLAAEPGIPSAGQFISLYRAALLQEGFSILSPCTHHESCPMQGGRRGKKWCHFVFDTAAVPKSLNALSVQARLAKEKATLSFLFAQLSDFRFQISDFGGGQLAVAGCR